MKIKVCVPYYWDYKIAFPGIQELLYCKEHQFEIKTVESGDAGYGRNLLVSKSQMKKQKEFGDFDYFLFIDSDISFHLKDVLALLAHKKDIISAAYIRRDRPHFFQAGMWDEKIPGNIKIHFKIDSKGLHKVDYVGAGFLLVNAEVFVKIEYPWFRRALIEKENCQVETGEDYGFCLQLNKADVDIWVDCDTKVIHVLEKSKSAIAESKEGFIPASIAEDILRIAGTLSRLSAKYSLCYEELIKIKGLNK